MDVIVESASIGPAAEGSHDVRVLSVAREAGLALPSRQPRIFDELSDIVHYDLVLVMDKFDLEAVSYTSKAKPSFCTRTIGTLCTCCSQLFLAFWSD